MLLVLSSGNGLATGAVVGSDGTVEELSTAQVSDVVGDVTHPGSSSITVEGIGEYRVYAYQLQNYVAIVGLPLSDVQGTIAQIFAAVLGISAVGLLVLGVAIALIVRAGLRPLRAVAETATRVANVPMAAGAVSITERVPDDRGRPAHRDRARRPCAEHPARPRRRVAGRPSAQRGADAAVRRRREPRAAHAPGVHPRLFGAVAARPAHGPRGRAGSPTDVPVAEDPTEQSLERIQAQSLRMTTLVEDLLLLARLDEGQELVYGTVDLTRLAIEAVGDARPAGPDHVWVLDVDEEPVVIAGDAARLHQVAANLLANARTHTPAGTTVTVSVAREGTDAVLRVHDDGPGIDPAVRDELFERFSRADRSRARKTGGTGLGLSIARRSSTRTPGRSR